MQQRLADLGYEVTPNNEFDEYTEDALRRYQTDWLYAEGSGVADDDTLSQLEYHHANRDGGQQYAEEPVYAEPVPTYENPIYEGGGEEQQVSPDGQYFWDGQQWNPFANPTPLVDGQGEGPPTGLLDEGQIDEINRKAQEYGSYDDGQFNPFANPTPEIDPGTVERLETAAGEVYQAASDTYDQASQAVGEAWDGVVDEASKIMSGEEPLPDVRN